MPEMFNSRIHKHEKIGSGGFGAVYKCTITNITGPVAIKELLSSESTKHHDRERFIREVELQSRLSHPNILPILISDLDADPPWFAMPLALSSLADETNTLPYDLERANRIFRQILEGIRFAHENGVIHRDLKPENVLLFDGDIAKIGDFGLGKHVAQNTLSTTLTHTKEILGTIIYAAPEQLRELKQATKQSDIYSLGKMLYKMVTSEDPFPNPSVPKWNGQLYSNN